MTAQGGENVGTVLQGLVDRLNQHGDQLTGIASDYRIDLSGEGGGAFRLSIQGGRARVSSDDSPFSPKATIKLSVDDFLAIAEERASPIGLLMKGKIKFEGDMGEAMRLQGLLRS